MRGALTLILLALSPAPALGWTFSPLPVCTLSQDSPGLRVVVTHDPLVPDYAIALTLADATWPAAPAFHIQFRGALGLTIGTDRQVLSDGGRTLTVRDTGFGNVLDGIAFNTTARAFAGARAVEFPLDGAEDPVRAFRACAEAPALS
jgi:hypothetical protein